MRAINRTRLSDSVRRLSPATRPHNGHADLGAEHVLPPRQALNMYKSNEAAAGSFPAGRVTRRPALRARFLLDGVGFALLRGTLDFVLCALAGLTALQLTAGVGGTTDHAWVLALLPPTALVVLFARGMYRPRLRAMILDGVVPVVGAISVSTMLVLATFVALFPDSPPGAMLVWTWLLAVAYVSAGRIGTAFAQNVARRRQVVSRPTLIVGAGVVGTHVARRIEESRQYGLKPVGFLDVDPAPSIDMAGRPLPRAGGTRRPRAARAGRGGGA